MPASLIRKRAQVKERSTYERCSIAELLGAADDAGLSVAVARVAPGVSTAWHRLDGVTEHYLVLEGRGRAEVGELPPAEVGPGDLVRIPAGVRQRIANTGAGDLLFYCLCTPAFTPACYVDLEGQGPAQGAG